MAYYLLIQQGSLFFFFLLNITDISGKLIYGLEFALGGICFIPFDEIL